VPDRSLDEFATAGSADDESSEGASATDPDDDGDEDPDATDPDADPATPTVRWSPDGSPCAACGETVPRLWRADAAFVCADCKEW
jgi:hypothetical protein